ncbi:MAG: hypothetical protein HY749_22595 [Gammaproteobacteria bacterium]|nr:hypothetical protein [Gammaproteobacteria bacterium]MBI5615171.1 hypothetical protein [Gammaproteobacteria bacterium]
MNAKQVSLSGALIAALIVFAYMHMPSEAPRPAKAQVPPAHVVPARAVAGEEPPAPDWFAAATLPPRFVAPVSAWTVREMADYAKVLGGSRFDILVVPGQVQALGYDRATRSLASALLARSIGIAASIEMPDPYLVARALGEGRRTYEAHDVQTLAAALGVHRIVELHLGHDRSDALVVTVTSQMAGVPMIRRTFKSAPLAASDFAVAAFETLLPQILEFLGLHDSGTAATETGALSADPLPASPLAFFTADGGAARHCYVELALRRLTPARSARVAETFAEKAYLSLTGLAHGAPEYRALRARTLAALGYRAAALRELGAPRTEEEKAVVAHLEGNLPAVRALAAAEKNPLKRLLAEGDANELGQAYDVIEKEDSKRSVEDLRLPGRIWPNLAWRAFSDWDGWSQYDNAWLKQILDLEFPIPGYAIADLTGGAVEIGDEARLRRTLDESVRNHGRKILEALPRTGCCTWHPGRPEARDYMDLLQAIGDDDLLRRIAFYTQMQGRPESAIEYANSLDAVYRGHPYYALLRAIAELAQAKEEAGAAAEGLFQSSHEAATSAIYWEQGQSRVAADAFALLADLHSTVPSFRDNPYARDLPFHPDYPTSFDAEDAAQQIAVHTAALDNSISNFAPVEWVLYDYERDPATRDERTQALLKSIESRFIGNPARGELLAKKALAADDRDSAMKHDRENIEVAPGYWPSYMALGTLLVQDARPDEAARVFASFPGFRADSHVHPVALANYAFESGSKLFLTGHLELARPLYEIAARRDTGAAAELTSRVRLYLLDGKLAKALQTQFELAQHYRSPHQYRDYLALLFAGGHAPEAWAGFNALVLREPYPQFWEAAAVGHHREGISPAALTAWAQDAKYANYGDHRGWPAAYLLRYWITDRTPPAELAATLNELDMPTWQLENEWRHVARPRKHEDLQTVVGPLGEFATSEGAVLPLHMFDATPKHRVKSDLAYFSAAFRAYSDGDYSAALKTFEEAAAVYDLTLADFRYMLPYFALAASRASNTSTIERILAKIPPTQREFDYLLGKSIIAVTYHDAAGALRDFTLARYRRPPTDERPFLTHYTYGDIGVRLAELSGDAAIGAITLEWSRACMRLEPWQAWPYGVTAKLTDDVTERKRALAMLQYLDPGSARLSTFPKKEIDAAVGQFGGVNPFLALKQHVPELEL